MPRLRQDPTTWLWIIAGEARGFGAARAAVPASDECPFCPTADLNEEVLIAEKLGADRAWTVRVLADRAPVFHSKGELDRQGDGLYDHMATVGAHEVVVEGPAHEGNLGALPVEVLQDALEVCRDRITALKQDPRMRYIEVFQIQGQEAGALLPHPHAQILGSPMISTRVERELRAAHAHYLRKERCLYCDLVRQEVAQEKRLVELTAEYVLLCPYASRYPYEMWLLPRRHHSSFEQAMGEPGALTNLANTFASALRRAEAVAPALQFVLHTEPNRRLPTWLREEWQSLSEDYHWHLEITPRLRQQAKTLPQQEYFLNQVLPEDAARRLRNA